MSAVLLIANQEDDRFVISYFLRRAHITYDTADAGGPHLSDLNHRQYKLIILATSAADAASSLASIVQTTNIPVLVLCDAVNEETCISLLNAGVVAFIERTHSPQYLIAQVRALLRYQLSQSEGNDEDLESEAILLLSNTRTARIRDVEITFTRREFALLQILYMNRNRILGTAQLIESIWGFSGIGDKNMLRNLINRLRAKLESVPGHTIRIITVIGTGYLMQVDKPPRAASRNGPGSPR